MPGVNWGPKQDNLSALGYGGVGCGKYVASPLAGVQLLHVTNHPV